MVPGGAERDRTRWPGPQILASVPVAAAIVVPSALTAIPVMTPSSRPTLTGLNPGTVQVCTQPFVVPATIVWPLAELAMADTCPGASMNRCTCGSDCTAANSAALVCGSPGSSW